MSQISKSAAQSSDICRDRAISLFTYLRELTILRSKAVRNLEVYEHVIWLSHVPREPECSTVFWDTEEKKKKDLWLVIKKPNLQAVPPVSNELKPWVPEKDLVDSSEIAELLPKIASLDFTQGDASPEEVVVVEENKSLQFVKLADHPHITELWEKYLEQKWFPWAEGNERLKKIQKVYADLHAIYQEQKRKGEAYELVLCFGLLTWESRTSQRIRRHLVTAQASVELTAKTGTLYVCPAAEGAKPQLEQDMLEVSDRPESDDLNTIEQKIKEMGDDIHEVEVVKELLTSWVHAASPEGVYNHEMKAPQSDSFPAYPKVTYAPALILRRRTERGLIKTFNTIIEQLEGG